MKKIPQVFIQHGADDNIEHNINRFVTDLVGMGIEDIRIEITGHGDYNNITGVVYYTDRVSEEEDDENDTHRESCE